MEEPLGKLIDFLDELKLFATELGNYLFKNLHVSFLRFEEGKGVFVAALYRQRGKYARRLVHSSMAALAGIGIMIAPVIAQEFPGRSVNPWEIDSQPAVLSATTENPETDTLISEKVRDKVIKYTVVAGDTVSTIAEKFEVSEDTIRWQNDLKSKDAIKTGQTLEILPVTGVSHKVQKGDSIDTIAKKYDASSQSIVDFPHNTFVNDETFELAIGQVIIVPEGVRPADIPWSPVARVRRITPDAGTVVASGKFAWPTNGTVSQGFAWYHKATDISNKSAPNILAADSGKVIAAGWLDGYGYGNRVIMDHGNGFRTLYAHMSQIYVGAGQSVKRGDAIGRMGCTGRCTGTHLHFEVIQNGVYLNPLSVLR